MTKGKKKIYYLGLSTMGSHSEFLAYKMVPRNMFHSFLAQLVLICHTKCLHRLGIYRKNFMLLHPSLAQSQSSVNIYVRQRKGGVGRGVQRDCGGREGEGEAAGRKEDGGKERRKGGRGRCLLVPLSQLSLSKDEQKAG